MGSFWIVLSTFFISCPYVSIKAIPLSMAFYEIFLLRSIVVLSQRQKLHLRRMSRRFSSRVLYVASEH